MQTRHKVFISYYHHDDQYYKNKFQRLFARAFINKSVESGDIDADNSDEYIKRLIQENYLDDSSVLVVLVGRHTFCRKHVDWEISGALNKKVGGYSGLLGLCLPTHANYRKERYSAEAVPPRLVDNLVTGYASLYDWTTDVSLIRRYVQRALERRVKLSSRIDNTRPQFQRNRCQ